MSDSPEEKMERRIVKGQKKEQEKEAARKSMYKKIIIAVLILLAIPAFATLGKILSKPTVGLDGKNEIQIVESDHIRGPAEAKVTITEYSDFQCPACGAYYTVLKQLEETFPNDVRLVYRHLPLKQIHKNGERAAEAAEAAHKQGKFFEMHDKLFETQNEWSESSDVTGIFIGYAESLGLNKEQFSTDIDSADVSDRVNNDLKSSYTLNLSSTPTFFVNGVKIQNPNGFEAFKALIEKKLSE